MSSDTTGAKRIYRIDLGMKVILDLISIDGADRMEVEIVEDRYADIRLGYLGINTPLAKAILGHSAGELVPFIVEGTDDVRIIEVSPSGKAPPQDVAARREQTIRGAIDQSDRTNAVIFASSFSGKWGDYDPSSFIEEETSDHVNDKEVPST